VRTTPLAWIIAGVVVIALLALAAWFLSRKMRETERLRQRFGLEYGRTIGELRGQTKAESELKASEERVDAKQQDLSNRCARMNTITS